MKMTTHQSGLENPTTIVFLHGLGVSSWMWHDQIEALSGEYHCIAVDLPGNGDSYQVPWESFATTADQVAQLIADEAHGGRAHVVGLSLGGYVALHLLARHPDCVQSMITSGVTPSPLFKKKWLISPFSWLLSHMIKWRWLGRLNARMMQFPDDVVPIYLRDLERLSSEMVRRCYGEVLDFHLPESVSTAAEKLLITGGDKEAGAILRGYDEFAALAPACTVAKAAEAHHGWNGEHPERFTSMITSWITGDPLPAGLEIVHGRWRPALASV